MNRSDYNKRVKRLQYRTSLENWKGYRSAPVSNETWSYCLILVERIILFEKVVNQVTNEINYPFISASSTGSLNISWENSKSNTLDVEIRPDKIFEWEYDNKIEFIYGKCELFVEIIQIIMDFLHEK